jgi:hypothetical protein
VFTRRSLSRSLFCSSALLALSLVLLFNPAAATPSCTTISPTGAAAFDWFGFSVGTAGDVNGDGYADVFVGAKFNDAGGTNAGRAYVYHGGPGADAVADLVLTGAAADDEFGHSVGTAGDFNGDNYADVIVGAPSNDAGGTNAGRAYVYFGGPGADAVADLILTGASAGDQFGCSVATAGDVNGDGYDDVIVGAMLNDAGGTDAGRAYVFFGGPGADAVADLTLTGAAAGDRFGGSVGTAGDVNGDNRADLIVGAPFNGAGGSFAGRAYVFYGGPLADAVADLTLTAEAAGDEFGVSVGTAGDVNGDGFADVIVAGYLHDSGVGRAYVFYGGPLADSNPDLTLTGEAPGDQFGASVGTVGDVNRDGFADVFVGAHGNDACGAEAGRVYVFFGGPLADATADLSYCGEAGDKFGLSAGVAGMVKGNGVPSLIVGGYLNDAGGTEAGRAYVIPLGAPVPAVAPSGMLLLAGFTAAAAGLLLRSSSRVAQADDYSV